MRDAMRQNIQSTGLHAGKVWNILNQEGKLNTKQLEKNSKLTEEEIHTAIGWLARENKISEEQNTFFLGETNLTIKIGKHAGMIWKILDIWEEADLLSITHLARIDKKDAYEALGWLAREGKIQTTMNEKKISYQLKE